MVIQFSSCYAEDGMTVVTLQLVKQKFHYIIDDIRRHHSAVRSLEINVSEALYREILSLSEKCWPCEDLFVVRAGFRPISAELKKLINGCWQHIFKTEPVLHYRLKS